MPGFLPRYFLYDPYKAPTISDPYEKYLLKENPSPLKEKNLNEIFQDAKNKVPSHKDDAEENKKSLNALFTELTTVLEEINKNEYFTKEDSGNLVREHLANDVNQLLPSLHSLLDHINPVIKPKTAYDHHPQDHIRKIFDKINSIIQARGPILPYQQSAGHIAEELGNIEQTKPNINELQHLQELQFLCNKIIELNLLYSEIKKQLERISAEMKVEFNKPRRENSPTLIEINSLDQIQSDLLAKLANFKTNNKLSKTILQPLKDAIYTYPKMFTDAVALKLIFEEIAGAYLKLTNNRQDSKLQQLLKKFCNENFGITFPGKKMLAKEDLTYSKLMESKTSEILHLLADAASAEERVIEEAKRSNKKHAPN